MAFHKRSALSAAALECSCCVPFIAASSRAATCHQPSRTHLLFIPKMPRAGMQIETDAEADVVGFRCMTPRDTVHKLIAKAIKASWEKLAARLVHPCQCGFMSGRS